MKLRVDVTASDGAARTGVVRTARGEFRTPVFMPVGTRGAVRTVTTADLERLGVEIVLGNTYHLMLRPGADVVEALGGLHRFEDWGGHVLTDSGGYQVFSLGPKVTDEGVKGLAQLPGLKDLIIPNAAVTDAGLAELAKVKGLRSLSLARAKKISPRDARTLAREAACHHLQGQKKEFDAVVAAVEKFDAKPGMFWFELGERLERARSAGVCR